MIQNLTSQWETTLVQSLTQTLIHRFNQESVEYCHWKSNIDLARTFQGELDIDLLVSHNSLACATDILMQLGFKSAVPRWEPSTPGIFHFYGFDPNQNELVHLHMFTSVLTGESFLKSHLLPFKEMLLENSYSISGLRVTAKEAEMVLFVLRTYIKYGSFLDAVRVLRGDKKMREEAQWLKDGSDMKQVLNLLNKYCPVVDEEIFVDGMNAILNGDNFIKRLKLSYQIRRSLRVYRKYSFFGRLSGYFQILTGKLVKKLRRQKGSKILSSGGTIIAIVGADATGKSTMVWETSHWLRSNFVVNTVHAGKPPSTLLTAPINMLLAIYRRLKSDSKPAGKPEKDSLTETGEKEAGGGGLGSLIYALRAVCLAWDRRALLRKTRRSSAYGEVVVCDRYPTNAVGMMDSPRLLDRSDGKGLFASLYHRLAKMERAMYRQIPPPDIVLRLSVSLEIARQRNAAREGSDDEVYLQNRHQQAKDWFMPGTRSIQDINTDLSLTETLLAVKQAIWPSL